MTGAPALATIARMTAPFSLVFHPVGMVGSDDSPFRRALHEVGAMGTLDLACPYLALDVLDAFAIPVGHWRLITDLEAWMDSAHPPSITAFVDRHRERIRDCRGLHAKVALGNGRALLGSANFTRSGLDARHEMGVRIADAATVAELRRWYDDLWSASVVPDLARLRARAVTHDAPHVRQLREDLAAAMRGTSLGPAGPRVRTRSTARAPHAPSEIDPAEMTRIAEQLRSLFDDAQEASAALDVLREAIDASDLPPDDERLFVNVTSSRSQFRFSVTIGNKYVASLGRRKGRVTAALMVSEPTMRRADVRAHVVSLREPFAGGQGLYLARLPWAYPFEPPAGVLDDWRATVRAEAQRAGRSPYRSRWGFQAGAFYTVTDAATRSAVLGFAYG